ncbi:unnamed protein product, partial [Rotaria magnacalcarata]
RLLSIEWKAALATSVPPPEAPPNPPLEAPPNPPLEAPPNPPLEAPPNPLDSNDDDADSNPLPPNPA